MSTQGGLLGPPGPWPQGQLPGRHRSLALKMGVLERPGTLTFVRPCAQILSLSECGRLTCWRGILLHPEEGLGETEGEVVGPTMLPSAEAMTPSHWLLPALPVELSATPSSLCFSLRCCKCQKCQFHKKPIGGLFDLLSCKVAPGSKPRHLGFIARVAPWWDFRAVLALSMCGCARARFCSPGCGAYKGSAQKSWSTCPSF